MEHVDTTPKNGAAKNTTKNAQGEGSVRWRRGKAEVRLSLGPLGRKNFSLPTCTTASKAEERRVLLAELAGKLLAANRIERGLPLLEQAARAEGRELTLVRGAIDLMCKGETVKAPSPGMTFKEVAESWLKGELTRQFPDHVKPRKEADVHLRHLERAVFPVVGAIPMSRFTLEHAEEAMRLLPKHYSAGTRRCVALLIHRVVGLAVYPLRLLPHSPLPTGFVPPAPAKKAKAHLYPDEDAQLLGCREIPLCDRILYGFLNREGMRADEAFGLEPHDLDLERGAVALDKNKTNDPRAWALSPDVVRALRVWLRLRENDDPRFFYRAAERALRKPDPRFVFHRRADLAARLRDDLEQAGIKREILFEHNESRQRIRAHDLRATFITIGLATGRSETWIMDRTGHRSSEMVHTYRRAARSFAELGLGPLRPMDEAIPEIAEILAAERAAEQRAAKGAAAEPSTSASAPPPTEAPGRATTQSPPRKAPEVKERRTGLAATTTRDGKTAPNGDGTTGHEKPNQGPTTDVATAPPRWSLAGPTAPAGPRADTRPTKNPGKSRKSALAETALSISK